MAVTKTTTTGYGTRVKNSFGGIWTGIILFAAGTSLLWWNEGRAVKTAKMLDEAQSVAVHVDDVTDVDPSLTGQLIHATAKAETDEVLTDEDFGFSTTAIHLERKVEYYQFVEKETSETKDKLGGKQETTTTYTYKKSWTSEPVNSEDFEDPDYKGKNSTIMQFEEFSATAEEVTFGGYTLSKELIEGITGQVPSKLNIDESLMKAWNTNITRTIEGPEAEKAQEAAAKLASQVEEVVDSAKNDSVKEPEVEINDNRFPYVHVAKNVVYFGVNPNSPQIGDVRVTFKQVNPGLVSILAQVNGNTFEEFTAKNGKTLSTIRMGNVSMEKMFKGERELNSVWLWVCRIIGILVVIAGLKGIFDILSTILKVVPFLAGIMNWGVGLICNIVGVVWSLIVIAIAWLFYRPILAICLIVLAGAGIAAFAYRGKIKQIVQEKMTAQK